MRLRGRYPGNLNLSFAYVEGESLLMALKVGALLRRDEQAPPLSRLSPWSACCCAVMSRLPP